MGLIPAHAGKTHGLPPQMTSTGAHPRSRGENARAAAADDVDGGSSPLTRGKRRRSHRLRTTARLIPAHAGKTSRVCLGDPRGAAHPRSRGENIADSAPLRSSRGSSPLTRGKRKGPLAALPHSRLIPAHAGKTRPKDDAGIQGAAHPRSRGENREAAALNGDREGSSPLTRGKRSRSPSSVNGTGLIPAHAGKTPVRRASRRPSSAHPRSRGENWIVISEHKRGLGSSPLTRGKRRSRG